MSIAVVLTDRLHQESFEGTIEAELSSDGSSFLVSGTHPRGGRRYHGFQVYTPDGTLLWERIFASSSYRSLRVGYLAAGYIGAVVCDYDQNGEINIYDLTGRTVASRPMNGWTSLVMSDNGSWLALFNQQRRTLTVLGPPRLETIWTMRVAEGASGCFIKNGPELLLNEPGQARLFGGGGQVIWSTAIPGGVRWLTAVSPQGDLLAATTEDPDSSVYVLSAADGRVLWSQILVTGGHKGVTFSPDGRQLVVYDIGQYAAVYAMDTVTGEVVWRFYLKGDRSKSVLTVRDLQYRDKERYIVARVTETGLEDQTYISYSYLLLLSHDGVALWISPLGSQVHADVNAAAGLVVVTTSNLVERYSTPGRNTLTVVSFLEDLPPLPGP